MILVDGWTDIMSNAIAPKGTPVRTKQSKREQFTL